MLAFRLACAVVLSATAAFAADDGFAEFWQRFREAVGRKTIFVFARDTGHWELMEFAADPES